MFLSKNKKNNVCPCKPQFYYIKLGLKGVKIIYACFRDEFCYFSTTLGLDINANRLLRNCIVNICYFSNKKGLVSSCESSPVCLNCQVFFFYYLKSNINIYNIISNLAIKEQK